MFQFVFQFHEFLETGRKSAKIVLLYRKGRCCVMFTLHTHYTHYLNLKIIFECGYNGQNEKIS